MPAVRRLTHPIVLLAIAVLVAHVRPEAPAQQVFDSAAAQTAPSPLDREVRADMAFLASDELHGRGSATRDEHIAALFAAARFQSLGLVPAGDNGTYLQTTLVPASLLQHLSHSSSASPKQTWNAIAILRGTAIPEQTLLLTAHLDALGIGPPSSSGDTIYNGADDDASGVTAVLAFARVLAEGPRPRRTIVFALFGSEEIGGNGNAAFLAHPPVPLASTIANLEFEMIGRPDNSIPPGTLYLTGFTRSNLGPELAKHGARLLPDPHPGENFFQRSDNYALARQGIVAQTVSSYGLNKDYHQPSDDLATIDFPHLIHAIATMTPSIQWLANTPWKPAWNRGSKP